MDMNCPRCGHRVPVTLSPGNAVGTGAGCGVDDGPRDARTFDLEPPGTKSAVPRLVVANPRSIEHVRRELLDAHRRHVDASVLEEQAGKVHRAAQHATVDAMGRITQLRTELVRLVETAPIAGEAAS